MRFQQAVPLLAAIAVAGGVLAACSDNGPSGFSCTGNTPDLTGTWTLVTLDFGTGPIPNPPATGSFVFANDSVTIDLNVPAPPAPVAVTIQGKGSCTLKSGSKIEINSNAPAIGQAQGTYTFIDKPPGTADTLTATLTPQGQNITAVVARP